MTLPYIPGWGDMLKQNLPQLGSAIQDIITPDKKFQVALRQELAKNPELIGKMATIAKDNPEGLNSVFGENVAGFFSQLNETPQAQLQRQIAGQASTVAGERGSDVGAAALGIKDETTAARDELNLDDERKLSTFMASLPEEERKNAYFKQVAGVFKFDYDRVLRRAKNAEAAAPIAKLGVPELVNGWLSGKFNSDQVQGWMDLNPDTAALLLEDRRFNMEAGLRRELAKEAQKNGRNDLMQQLFILTAKNAAQLNVPPGALFEATYGFAAPDVVSGLSASYTSEDVKSAKVALQREEEQNRAKLFRPVIDAHKALVEKRNPGNIAVFNAAAQAVGINLRAEEKDKFGPNKLVYIWNDQEVKAEDIEAILLRGQNSSGTTKREDVPITEPATTNRSADGTKRTAGGAKPTPARKTKRNPNFAALTRPGTITHKVISFAVDENMTAEQLKEFGPFKQLDATQQADVLKSLEF